jgi:hypothetical protein
MRAAAGLADQAVAGSARSSMPSLREISFGCQAERRPALTDACTPDKIGGLAPRRFGQVSRPRQTAH